MCATTSGDGHATRDPAKSAHSAGLQEISADARMRGGHERTRTACQARSRIERVSTTCLAGVTRTRLELARPRAPGNGILKAETRGPKRHNCALLRRKDF